MKPTPRIRRYALLGASLCALASQMPTVAQEAEEAPAADSSLKLGSIVVTAQRREESINDVPMSIQAFGGQRRRPADRRAQLLGLAKLSGRADLYAARHRIQYDQPVGHIDCRHLC